MTNIDEELVHKISDLAKVELTPDEEELFQSQLGNIINYIEELKKIDISDMNFVHNMDDFVGDRAYADIEVEGLSRDLALQNATDGRSKGDFFVAQKKL